MLDICFFDKRSDLRRLLNHSAKIGLFRGVSKRLFLFGGSVSLQETVNLNKGSMSFMTNYIGELEKLIIDDDVEKPKKKDKKKNRKRKRKAKK